MPLPTNRLRVDAIYPVPAATGITVTSKIIVRFNIDVDPETLTSSNVMLKKGGVTLVDAGLGYDDFRRTLTITPDENLDPGAKYYIYLRGTESDDLTAQPLAGILGVDNEVLVGFYESFFTTELSAIEAPELLRPAQGAAVSHADVVYPDQIFYWNAVDIYAAGTTETMVAAGAVLADEYLINGYMVTVSARAGNYSRADNAIKLAEDINSSGAPVIATANSNGTITLSSNVPGEDNPVVIQSVGTHNVAHLDELGIYQEDPLNPGSSAYVIEADAVTYEIEVDIDSIFDAPTFSSDGIVDPYFTPGALLPIQQLYWRVRAHAGDAVSTWSETRSFYNGVQEADSITGDDIYISPIGDGFKVIRTYPEDDSTNNYTNQISIQFNDEVYAGSITDTSIEVIGQSMVSWEPSVGQIFGICELQEDGRTIVFTPTINFGAHITWSEPPVSWYVDTLRIYRSTSRFGKYTLIDTVYPGMTSHELVTSYTDETVAATDTILYWYRVEFLGTPNETATPDVDFWPETTPDDELYNVYPMTEPIPGRSGGFVGNQVYRVTVNKDLYSALGSTTDTVNMALGQDYVFYFTGPLHPLYATVSDLETVIGTQYLAGLSTISLSSMLLANSYAAFRASLYGPSSIEYSIDQFCSISSILCVKAPYFVCYVVYKTLYDLFTQQDMTSKSLGTNVKIGDFSISDSSAGSSRIDPRIEDFKTRAEACLAEFSFAFYQNVATWAIKASPLYGYGYSPYAPWEYRSWISDKPTNEEGY